MTHFDLRDDELDSRAIAPVDKGRTEFVAKDLFWRWERLRLVYNVILGLQVTILILGLDASLLLQPRALFTLACEAIGANVCFCAGPVADYYLHRLGIGAWSRGSTATLFVLGMLISVLSAGVCVLLLYDRFGLKDS